MNQNSHILNPSVPYVPCQWQFTNINPEVIPKCRVNLGRFPTPIHKFDLPGVDDLNLEFWIKRDDLSSFDLSGNKVRKLEFLLADACEGGHHDSVITIGGIQSNHARATAVASRQLGLEPHLILRKQSSVSLDLTGNLLLNRMVGAKIYTITPQEYGRIGSDNLVDMLASNLKQEGKNPYKIPVGGSNALGSFGYMEAIKEIQDIGMQFDHIVFACGSGGTAAGLAIGAKLSGLSAKIHGIGVCDNPKYFYDHIAHVADELGIDYSTHGYPRDWISIYDGQGIGYAKSTDEELTYQIEVSMRTGVILDPVYSGKALYHFIKKLAVQNPETFSPGHKVLFIHTGGTFGLYDKSVQVLNLLPEDDIKPMLMPIA